MLAVALSGREGLVYEARCILTLDEVSLTFHYHFMKTMSSPLATSILDKDPLMTTDLRPLSRDNSFTEKKQGFAVDEENLSDIISRSSPDAPPKIPWKYKSSGINMHRFDPNWHQLDIGIPWSTQKHVAQ